MRRFAAARFEARRLAAALAGALALACAPLPAQPQPRKPAATATAPSLSASQRVMAGSPLAVLVGRVPDGARLAIARPTDPPATA
ncbi:MAG: hypothetical protein ACT6UR_20775, partial [Bosea sp. (in: a-proteobacteria)]